MGGGKGRNVGEGNGRIDKGGDERTRNGRREGAGEKGIGRGKGEMRGRGEWEEERGDEGREMDGGEGNGGKEKNGGMEEVRGGGERTKKEKGKKRGWRGEIRRGRGGRKEEACNSLKQGRYTFLRIKDTQHISSLLRKPRLLLREKKKSDANTFV